MKKYLLIETSTYSDGTETKEIIAGPFGEQHAQGLIDSSPWGCNESLEKLPAEIRVGCTRNGDKHVSHSHLIVEA